MSVSWCSDFSVLKGIQKSFTSIPSLHQFFKDTYLGVLGSNFTLHDLSFSSIIVLITYFVLRRTSILNGACNTSDTLPKQLFCLKEPVNDQSQHSRTKWSLLICMFWLICTNSCNAGLAINISVCLKWQYWYSFVPLFSPSGVCPVACACCVSAWCVCSQSEFYNEERQEGRGGDIRWGKWHQHY